MLSKKSTFHYAKFVELNRTLFGPIYAFFAKYYWYKRFPYSKINFRGYDPKSDFKNASIEVGRDTYGTDIFLAANSAGAHLRIGSRCIIQNNVSLLVTSDHITGSPLEVLEKPGQFIEIGDDVFIGYNVVVLSNVKIGKGATVGANAVVTHDVAAYDVVVGVPAHSIERPRRTRRVKRAHK